MTDECPRCSGELVNPTEPGAWCRNCFFEKFTHADLIAAQRARLEAEDREAVARAAFKDAEGQALAARMRVERIEGCLRAKARPKATRPHGR